MFERLRTEIEGLEIPVDGAAIIELHALTSALNARLATAVGEFDAAGLYELDHDVSLRRWLANRCDLTELDAGRLTRLAKRLHRYPALAAAWVEGRLADGQVHAIVAQLTERRLPIFDDNGDGVIGELEGLDVPGTVTAMGLWAERADAVLADQLDGDRDDSLHFSRTLDGRRVLSGNFGVEGGEIIERALGLATRPDREGDTPTTPAQRRAAAEVDVHRFYLDHHQETGAPRQRPHVVFVWDQDRYDTGLGATTIDGDPLDRQTSERLLCDCSVARLVRSRRGQILDYGLTVRNPPRHLRDAVVVRDHGCRWPGCGRPARHCDAHHVVWFTRGGRTAIENLALLCIRHHHKLHGRGWSATLDADTAELVITTPDGQVLRSRPPPVQRAQAA